MRKIDLRKRLGTAVAIALTMLATVVVLPTPAAANPSQGYVIGVGSSADDWTDEGPVSSGARNNVVAMWQQILWADGYLPWSGIDCAFGPQTSEATRRWKIDHGLPNDGIAGNGAFTAANAGLEFLDGIDYWYPGIGDRFIRFQRRDDIYWMSISGDWHRLGYNFASFNVCN